LARPRNERSSFLDLQPTLDLIRQRSPFVPIGDDLSYAVGEIGRKGKFSTLVGWHLGLLRSGARNIDLVFDQRLVSEDLAGENEGVAGHQRLDEMFLDCAQNPPAARNHLRGTRAHEPHLEHIGLDDGADIHAIALRNHGMGHAPAAILALSDLGEALVGFERISPGGDEVENGVEVGARKPRIGRGASHLGI
jgi:hypothetical protein